MRPTKSIFNNGVALIILILFIMTAGSNSWGQGSLEWSTFLGGTQDDCGADIAVDSMGNVYVTGHTNSSDFPTTPGAYDPTFNQCYDVFIIKLNPSGSQLIYSTFLGGSGSDCGCAIAIDDTGAVYVCGTTMSRNFPTTVGCYDQTCNGCQDTFVAKLNSAATELLWSTFLGGSYDDIACDIAVDETGHPYLIGWTGSLNFPTTPGAYEALYNGGYCDVFVVKLDPWASGLLYATFIGGLDCDWGRAIAIDPDGNSYLVGATYSSNFPTTPEAFDTTHNGCRDCFVTKLNSAGSDLLWSTFLGGTHSEDGYDITIDDAQEVYVTGETYSPDFPATMGAYDMVYNGARDSFIAKLNSSASQLLWSTFLGGSGNDGGRAINRVYASVCVTGWTESSNFPTTPGAYDTTFNGSFDAYIVMLNYFGSNLDYSSFLGGSRFDRSVGIAAQAPGHVFLMGDTDSFNFPTTPGAYDTTYAGGKDAFVAKFSIEVTPTPTPTPTPTATPTPTPSATPTPTPTATPTPTPSPTSSPTPTPTATPSPTPTGVPTCIPISVATWLFEPPPDGWTYHTAPPPVDMPGWAHASSDQPSSPGAIGIISPADEATDYFGYWANYIDPDNPAIPWVPNSVWRATYTMSTDKPDPNTVPSIRLRYTLNHMKATSYIRFYPGGWLPLGQRGVSTTDYKLYMRPPIEDNGFFLAFDLIDFGAPFGAVDGTVYLEEVTVERFDLGVPCFDDYWTTVTTYSGAGLHNWTHYSAGVDYLTDVDSYTTVPEGLKMATLMEQTRSYGAWVAPVVDVPLVADQLYRAKWKFACQNSTEVATIRMRMHTSDFRYASYVVIDRAADSASSALPPLTGKDYYIYADFPVTPTADGLFSAWDLYDFDPGAGGWATLNKIGVSKRNLP